MEKLKKGNAPRNKTQGVHRDNSKELLSGLQREDIQRDSARPVQGERTIVRSIVRGPQASLVQWEESQQLKRGWVPNTSLDENWQISREELNRAMPYGLPFQTILECIIIDNNILANELRRRHIWTEADILQNPMEISRAIVAAAHVSVAKIQTLVRDYIHKSEEEVKFDD